MQCHTLFRQGQDGTFMTDGMGKAVAPHGTEKRAGPADDTERSPVQKVILPYEIPCGTEYYVASLAEIPARPFYAFWKRFLDITVSWIGIFLFLPLMLLIGILIRCTSPGPVFFLQDRVGLNGKKFRIIKFRTMCTDAEKGGARWSEGAEDERIYPFGRFLRRTRLDELPQLWCCVIGTMSLVGPRPERECFYVEFEKYIHGFRERTRVKPGITGLAQVSGGYDLRPEEKMRYDAEYIRKRSLRLDAALLLRTVKVILTGRGAK